MRCLSAALVIATLLLPQAASAGDYAPLNCDKANSPAERTICKSYDLGQDEARMATLFAIATSLVAMGQRGDIQDAQRKWLQSRDACGKKVACLGKAYDARIRELDAVVAGVVSRGPF
jgi:uncharacterized protein